MNWEQIFSLICSIPHASGNEMALRDRLCSIAAGAGLQVRVDARGNMAVDKAAARGCEKRPVVILQGHLDMVAQKADNVDFDFDRQGISFSRDGDWVSTGGRTSLGADNGLGIALIMELLLDPDWQCGPLRGVFTVEEEAGLCGSREIDPAFLDGRYLINLDSEDDNCFMTGCAGSCRLEAELAVEYTKPAVGGRGIELTLAGLPGGHSGVDIHKPLGNAVKEMVQLLTAEFDSMEISTINGGTVFNALPRSITVAGVLPGDFVVPDCDAIARRIASAITPGNSISLRAVDIPVPETVLTPGCRKNLLSALRELPNGVLAWSRKWKDMVETSSNLAAVRSCRGSVKIDTSQRSFIAGEQEKAVAAAEDIFGRYGFSCRRSGSYPPWEPAAYNPLLDRSVAVWEAVTGTKAECTVMHAGVEVADFISKNPALLAVSAGPLIENPHSPAERFSMASTLRVRKWLRELLLDIR